ncbi:MAG: hypothetical protein KZQ90_07535 [Candidatus Thiodiazotropha sp. (ex Codakia rugifera)]|nr:hypothetical protein [Candidatus Thiodiazotropha sp. (ex Codakia rugifera)]
MDKSFIKIAIYPMSQLLLACCIPVFSVEAAENGYIEAVKADVAEFTTSEFQPPADSSWIGTVDNQSKTSGELLVELEDFSKFLQDKSPGSYIFYTKLPEVYKKRLHQEYLATGNLDHIKNNIFKYSRDIKKK